MKALLHPTYFPNIASLTVLVQSEFIWEVWDNYQKQTFRNRCHITTDQGRHTLTIPIKHTGGDNGRQKYKEVRIDNSVNWQRQHWRTLQTAYRTSPYFEFYEDHLAPLYTKKYDFLMDFNFDTIAFLLEHISVETFGLKTGTFETNPAQVTDYRALATAKKGNIFSNTPYIQVFDDRNYFVTNASGIDLLFNEGTNALNYLQQLRPPSLHD
ncbi:WbqC family protein [Croceitalea sp. MTPC5]|uniref:WbqC family protein n=1 Tax=Croceitalea sp. MTPC5 TaxID=3056565 RepID=UPI002B398602|nr:WbqC family protein [Croceitalea sp. MTPC5]